MKHHTRKLYIIASAVIFILLIVSVIAFLNTRNSNLLDKKEYKQLVSEMTEAEEQRSFTTQDQLTDYITTWADSIDLPYTLDSSKNIIFEHEASAFKTKVAPTVIIGSYNYETIDSNIRLLASLAMIAKSDLMSGQYTVIMINDENNSGSGYRKLSKDYFTKKSKVIYLDYGKSSYISTSSFGQSLSTITLPADTTDAKCDTALRIRISGLNSDEVGTSKQANTVAALSTLLTRLKSKSTICQLASFAIEDHGNMNPVSLDATILLNSYSLGSFTKYLDKQIESWNKKYLEDEEDLDLDGDGMPDFEGFSYTYEVVEDPEAVPTTAYTDEALDQLTSILYMINTGVYRYEATDIMPDERSEGDTCGINSVIGLSVNNDEEFVIKILSQGYSDAYLDRIHIDNRTVAEFFNCEYEITSNFEPYANNQDSISRILLTTYNKVSDVSNVNDILRIDTDNYFTPCSYLASKRKNLDLVHIRLNKDKVVTLTNTIMCYIATKGNLLSL